MLWPCDLSLIAPSGDAVFLIVESPIFHSGHSKGGDEEQLGEDIVPLFEFEPGHP